MIKYMIAKGDSSHELMEAVNTLIKNGWTPLGGLSAIKSGHKDICYQAMVKDAR